MVLSEILLLNHGGVLVTSSVFHQLSGLLSLNSPLYYRAAWGSAACLRGKDGSLLCVSLCCTASSGASFQLSPGSCSLVHILSVC